MRDEVEVVRIARAAAADIGVIEERNVSEEVEQFLIARLDSKLSDPVSLGALVVSIATLAWTVATDVWDRCKDAEATRKAILDELRKELKASSNLSQLERDQIIAAVAAQAADEVSR